MTLRHPAGPLALAAALFCCLPASAAAPPEGRCPSIATLPEGALSHQDATPMLLREGMVLDYENILALRELVPIEIWRNRDQFFYEGMRMEVGPCHRRYPVPSFQADATTEFANTASVDDDGNLLHYVAGTPFLPEDIDGSAETAGVRWAWNLQTRYRGAGPIGEFRLIDMPASVGSVQTYEGSFFYIQSGHRADLASNDYQLPEARNSDFVAGGRFDEPTDARHLAWTQHRLIASRKKADRSDETFVYVPTMRKMRRAPTNWVDGVYTPRYRVSGDSAGGGMAAGGGSEFSFAGSIAPTAGRSIATAEHIRQGFSDLALRPNSYVWRVVAEREVLAPINSSRSGYPINNLRNYGPSGLSVASDRWDIRWAVVIEGLARRGGTAVERIVIWVDYLTQVPLYFMTKRRDGRLLEVGIPVHRFSGDTFDYPTWPNGERAYVFDPVAAVYFNVGDGGSAWRRESFDVKSVPINDGELMRFLSADFLLRGR